MKKKIIISLLAFSVTVGGFSQGGYGVYQILDLPMDSRSIGLGGVNVSICDGDLNLALNNPAILMPNSHNMLTLSYANYLSDINFGSAGYARSWKENNFAIALNYLDFGRFKRYNEYDVLQGSFTAKDIVLNLLFSRQFGKYFSVGGNLKTIFSYHERYSSMGMALDLGSTYHNEDVLLDLGLTVKNIGFQFYGYSAREGSGRREALPINIIFGISKQLKKAPFRFSLTLHSLQSFNLNYERTSAADRAYKKASGIKWYDMMFRHTIFAIEVMPMKQFYLSTAFNYRRRAEMDIPVFRSMAGFSFGAGLRIKGIKADFSLTQFQSGNLTYHLTFSTDLKDFGIK